MVVAIGEELRPARTRKAGAFGVFSVVFYGLVCVVAVFVAAYFWLDGDAALAAALGLASLAIPVTFGFFMAEIQHQRAGVLAFVVAAAVVAGSAAASAWYEREDYFDRRDLLTNQGVEADGLAPSIDDLLGDLIGPGASSAPSE